MVGQQGVIQGNQVNGGHLYLSNGIVEGNTVIGGTIQVQGHGHAYGASVVEDEDVGTPFDNEINGWSAFFDVGGRSGDENAYSSSEVINNDVHPLDNQVGIRIKTSKVIFAHNSVTGGAVGLHINPNMPPSLVSSLEDRPEEGPLGEPPVLSYFQAYDNILSDNETAILWGGNCEADCSFEGSRFTLKNNTLNFRVDSQVPFDNLVNLHLRDSWWGSAEPLEIKSTIADRFSAEAAGTDRVGLFFAPWLSGEVAIADYDNDGILDVMDSDDDGDGICDAQEARKTMVDINPPVFVSTVDEADFPNEMPDCDEDDIGDVEDDDDDNDGLTDEFEVNTLNTNPALADSDGDGIADNEEYDLYYDPNDNQRYPMRSPRGYLSPSNMNDHGGWAPFKEDWEVSGAVLIPEGVELSFANEKKLKVVGLLLAMGSETAPVVMKPLEESWGGIEVERGGGTTLRHRGFSGANGVQEDVTGVSIDLKTSQTFIENSVFHQNQGLLSGARLRIWASRVEGNSFGLIRGGLYASAGHISILNSHFENNFGQGSGQGISEGVSSIYSSVLIIGDSQFEQGVSALGPGIIVDNEFVNGIGFGISLDQFNIGNGGTGRVIITENLFSKNISPALIVLNVDYPDFLPTGATISENLFVHNVLMSGPFDHSQETVQPAQLFPNKYPTGLRCKSQ